MRPGCHRQLSETPWVHGPVAVASCDVCHQEVKVQGKKHQFRLTRSKEELCTYCHGQMASGPVTHKVVTDSGCTKCHNSHGAAKRNLLITQDIGKLCGECHEPMKPLPLAADGTPLKSSERKLREKLPTFSVLHEPVKKGDCLNCHGAHRSKNPALLRLPKQELCLACHDKVNAQLAGSPYSHKPVTKDCSLCHVAHGNNVKRLLPCEPRILCLSCHTQVADAVLAGYVMPGDKVKPLDKPDPELRARLAKLGELAPPENIPDDAQRLHGGIRDSKGCVQCHGPHAGEQKTLVKTPLGPACYACHDKEITVASSGRVIPNIKDEMAAAVSKHKPVEDGLCEKCHPGHSSQYPKLLAKKFPEGLYATFEKSEYALCFECHDARLGIEERTVRTGFRDGDRNLHFLHIHDEDQLTKAKESKGLEGKRLDEPVRKGRTCRMCHGAHSAAQARDVRRSVPYGPGGWQLQITFKRTEKGGTCLSACHKEKSYQNVNPPAPPKEPDKASLGAGRRRQKKGEL